MRGREVDGWLRVDSSALKDSGVLERWVNTGVGRARSLAAE
jgi:hypothetical protein